MAADRGMRDEDNSVEEGNDNTDGSHSPPKGMCKKNGLTNACHCNGKTCRPGDCKRSKTCRDGRVNGVTKIPLPVNFSIPTLRSRAAASTNNNSPLRPEKTPLLLQESPRKRRRSLRRDKQSYDDRSSPMGPVSDNSIESKSDSSGSDLADPSSALSCSQPTDLCTNVQSTLLGPISPDTSRSCTPPLSSGSSQSTASCTSLLSAAITGPPTGNGGDLCSSHPGYMDLGAGAVGGGGGGSRNGKGNHSSSSSTTSSSSEEILQVKCNGSLQQLVDRNNLYSLFPSQNNHAHHQSRTTALCTASSSASGFSRLKAATASSKANHVFGSSRSSSSSSSSTNGTGTSSNSSKQSGVVSCLWIKCTTALPACDLMDHIRKEHVETQFQKPPAKDPSSCPSTTTTTSTSSPADSAKYVCLWTGCKVYNKPSCSQSWLQRHILSHSGDKPFQCIVDGCGLRFTSQGGLERHVNSHFNVCPPVKSCSSKGKDDTPSKLLKRKKLKRRKSWLIKTEDFFDSRVMETLRHQLVVFSEHTNVDGASTANIPNVTFHSSVIARRTECSGKVKVLLRWTPKDILPDSWVPESEMDALRQQTLPLSSLPRDTVHRLHPSIYARHRYRKHRRK